MMMTGSTQGVKHCCWHDFTLDPTEYNSIEAMWNSDASQEIRQTMLDGKYPDTCPESCRVRTSGGEGIEWIEDRLDRDSLGEAERANLERLLTEVQQGNTELKALPPILNIYNEFECNVDCVMCWEQYYEDDDVGLEVKSYPDYETFFGEAEIIDYQGGEPMLGKTWADITDALENHPNKQVRLITNALLLELDKLRPYISQIKSISISLNGATKEAHERINRGSDWETVIENIERFTAGLSAIEGSTPNIYIGMVVLPSNYYEVPLFAALAEQLGVAATFTLGRGEGFIDRDGQSVINYTTPRELDDEQVEHLVHLCKRTQKDYDADRTIGLGSVLEGIEQTLTELERDAVRTA